MAQHKKYEFEIVLIAVIQSLKSFEACQLICPHPLGKALQIRHNGNRLHALKLEEA